MVSNSLVSMRCKYCNLTFSCSSSSVFSKISFCNRSVCIAHAIGVKLPKLFHPRTWMSCCCTSRCLAIDFSWFWAAIAAVFACSTSPTIFPAISINWSTILRRSCNSMLHQMRIESLANDHIRAPIYKQLSRIAAGIAYFLYIRYISHSIRLIRFLHSDRVRVIDTNSR